jgi:hypothetical protein
VVEVLVLELVLVLVLVLVIVEWVEVLLTVVAVLAGAALEDEIVVVVGGLELDELKGLELKLGSEEELELLLERVKRIEVVEFDMSITIT